MFECFLMRTKILIVEDESITAMDLENILQRLGYEVVGISSRGDEAIQNVDKLRPDLVLMDITLKGDMDGIEATWKIQTHFDIPVIYLTAYSDFNTLKRAKSTKPYGFLTKPVNPDGLQASIETALYNYDLDKRLRESEEKYRQIVETANEGIWALDENFKTTFVNQRMAEMLGYTVEEMMARHFTFFILEEDVKDHHVKIKSRKLGNSAQFEGKLRHKNGSDIYVTASTTSLKDGSGAYKGSITMFTDITERKIAEEELQENQAKYRALIETNMDFIWEMDAQCRFTYCSPQMESLWGIIPEDMIGKTPFDMMPEHKRESALEEFMNIASYPTGFSGLESTAFDGQGNLIYLETSGIPFFDDKDNLLGYRGITRDITERKKVEKDLIESKLYYSSIFENTGAATVIVKENRIISMANKEFENLSGYSKDEIEGKKSWTEFVIDEDLQKMQEYHKKRFIDSSAVPNRYEFRFKDREGNVKNIYINMDVIPGTKNSIASLLDITDLKKAEKSLMESEEKFRALAENSPDIISRMDRKLRYIYINHGSRTLGLSPGEFIGKKLEEIAPSQEIVDVWIGKSREVLETGEIREFEYEFPSIHGLKVYHSYIIPEYNTEGEIDTLLGVSREITERKLAEEESRVEHQKLLDIIEFLPDATFVIDGDKKVIAWNRAIEEMTGVSKDEIIGKGDYEYSIPFYGYRRPILVDLIFLDDRERESEYDFVKRDGNTLFAEVYVNNLFQGEGAYVFVKASPLLDREGNVVGSIESIRDITQRKKIEQIYKESEERNRLLIENAGLGIGHYDIKGKIIMYNKIAASYFNGVPEDFEGKTLFELFDEESASQYMKRLKISMNSVESQVYEDYVPLPTGNKWLRSIYTSIKNSLGEIIGVQVISDDITDRKRVEKALRESKEKYRDLIGLLPQPVYESDLNGNITFANQVGLETFGFTQEDVDKGLNMLHILSPEDQHRAMKDIQRALNREEFVGEYNAVRKDGTIFPVIVYANPIIHENEVIGLRGIVVDITELKQQERELELLNKNLMESEERFKALINNSTSIIRILDKDGLIVFDSPSSSRILGYPEGYFIGKDPLDFIHPEDRPKVKDALKEVFENKNDGIPTEFRIKKADGTYHPFETIAQNLTRIPGIDGILVITNSILRRKRFEDRIRRSLRDKEVLLQEVHHRVKNNMQVISSLLNLQKEQVGNGVAVNVLQESQNRVRSMALVHERLYKSNNLTSINFKEYIHELVTDLFQSYGISKENIIPVLDIKDIALNIETAIPCGLIVSELVSNSLKYAFLKEKKGKIFVGLKIIDGGYELRICDNGSGFARVPDLEKNETLGLRLVNNLVNQIEGQIELNNSNGVDFKIKFREIKYNNRVNNDNI